MAPVSCISSQTENAIDTRKPILEARSIALKRGAGFYYDRYVAIRWRASLSIIIVDEVFHRLLRKDFSEYGRSDFKLAMYDEEAPLW